MELKPGYKQTEVGVIPEDWDVISIGKACRLINGRGFKPHEWEKTGLPIIRIQNLNGSNEYNYFSGDYDSKIEVREGQLLFAWSGSRGSSFGPHIWHGPNALLNYHTWKVVINEKVVERGYFYHALKQLTAFIEEKAHGASALVHTQKWEMEKFLIVAPTCALEQHKIANTLSVCDELIADLEALLRKKRNIKQAAMQELLTGKRRLPGFEGEWEVTAVKDVVSRHFCGPSPTCEERNIEGDDEWGVLKTTAITWEHGWSWKAHKLLPSSYWGKSDLELRAGDVLVTKAGPRHRVGVSAWVDHVPRRIIPSGKMIALRPITSKVQPLMLASALASRETQIYLDQRTTGMAESQVNFENSVLLSALIALPGIDEQSAISEICIDFDRELRELEDKVVAFRQVKEGMMQQLLTGKIRLT